MSDLGSEMKNMYECNKTNYSHVECNKRMELMENQINFLQEECNFKTKLINSLLENLFNHENHQTKLHNNNATLTPGKADDDFQFPKRQACKRSCQSQSNPKLTLSNRYESLRDYDISERNDDVIVTKVSHLLPEQHASEKNIKTSDSRKQNDQKRAYKRDEFKQKNKTQKKLPATVTLGDSLVKDIKGWELSDESSKVVTKHFSGANTTDMKSYLLPTKSRNPENIVLHCGTNNLKRENSANEFSNDIIEVALLRKSDNNNVLVSGIIPRSDKLNAKATEVNRHLKNECHKRNICFISNSNINPKYDCNKSGLHLNWKGTNKLVENFLFALSKFDN